MSPRPQPSDDARALLAASAAARRRGDHREGAALALRAARAAEQAGDAATEADAYALLALHHLRLGQLEAAITHGRQALAHFAAQGPTPALSRVHSTLSAAFERAGLSQEAVAHAAQALGVARSCGDLLAECWALNRLGTAADDASGEHQGLSLLAQALELARRVADDDALGAVLNNLARRWVVEADRIAGRNGDARPVLQQALPLAEEAVRLAERGGMFFAMATAAANLAGVLRRLGEPARAWDHYLRALSLAQQHGYTGLAATLRTAQASMDFEEAPGPQTQQALQQRLDEDAAAIDPDLQLQARRVLVQGCRALGDLPAALAHLERLHADALAAQSRRADLQSRLLVHQAELDHARHEAELQRLRADGEERLSRRLQQERDALEREVAARTAELQRALAAGEAASRAKSVFLSMVSHELRTPLNGVLGMVELARRRAADPRQAEQLATAADSARELNALVDGILNFVAADTLRPPVIVDTDLQQLLADVQQQVLPRAQAKGLALRVDVDRDLPPRLALDADRVGRILTALLDNAVKFSAQGPVELVAGWDSTPGGPRRLRLAVADRGPGLAPEVLHRVFNPFEVGDGSSTRAHGGLGLGLALVHRLVQGLGGDVGVDARATAGSTFWVALPVG